MIRNRLLGPMIAAIAIAATSTPSLAQQFKRIDTLNAVHDGNFQSIMPRSEPDKMAALGYAMGVQSTLDSNCGTSDQVSDSLAGLIGLFGLMGGGMIFSSAQTEGVNDAKALIANYGCKSPITSKVSKNSAVYLMMMATK